MTAAQLLWDELTRYGEDEDLRYSPADIRSLLGRLAEQAEHAGDLCPECDKPLPWVETASVQGAIL